MLLRAKHLQADTWEHCWLHVGKSSSQDKCLCWELQPKRVVLTTKGSANPWCNKYAATLIKYTGQMASLSFCAEQTLSWQQSRDLFDVMWHYFFSCSSCCYLSSACSFSQSVSRGNFWCAEKELTQQCLPPSASLGAGPIFLHCQQRWWVVAWRGPGWAEPEFGSTACPVCGGKSSASISLPSEAQESFFTRAAEDEEITSTLICPVYVPMAVQTGFQTGCRLPQKQRSPLSPILLSYPAP